MFFKVPLLPVLDLMQSVGELTVGLGGTVEVDQDTVESLQASMTPYLFIFRSLFLFFIMSIWEAVATRETHVRTSCFRYGWEGILKKESLRSGGWGSRGYILGKPHRHRN